jgi:hypothetical protein
MSERLSLLAVPSNALFTVGGNTEANGNGLGPFIYGYFDFSTIPLGTPVKLAVSGSAGGVLNYWIRIFDPPDYQLVSGDVVISNVRVAGSSVAWANRATFTNIYSTVKGFRFTGHANASGSAVSFDNTLFIVY